MRRDYTPIHDTIVAMTEQGYTNERIANELEITNLRALRAYKLRRGIPSVHRGIRKDVLDAVVRMSKSNTPVAEIAERLGVNVRMVERYRKRAGLTAASSFTWTPKLEDLARQMLTEEASYTEVANTVGCEWHAIQRKFGDEFPSWNEQQAVEYRRMLSKARKEMAKAYGGITV